jgi:hypothetical protein
MHGGRNNGKACGQHADDNPFSIHSPSFFPLLPVEIHIPKSIPLFNCGSGRKNRPPAAASLDPLDNG